MNIICAESRLNSNRASSNKGENLEWEKYSEMWKTKEGKWKRGTLEIRIKDEIEE